jgi:hypothetical protein
MTNRPKLSDDTDETTFEKGVQACYDGKDLSDNPHEDCTTAHHEWMTGWYSGEHHLKAR